MRRLSSLVLLTSLLCFSGACAEQKGRKKEDKDKKADQSDGEKANEKANEKAAKKPDKPDAAKPDVVKAE